MKITNLKPEMSTLTKTDALNYTLDYGTIPHKSDPNLKLEITEFEQKPKVKVSCGGCTTARLSENILNITYDTSLLGRINKYVYLFEGETKTTIKLTGRVQ